MHTLTFMLRDARESDLPDILAMIRELAAFENLENELQVTAASLHEALFGSHPVASALMAFAAGSPVGYAIYYRTFSSFTGGSGLFLEDVFVRPAWRQKGLGRALLERVAQAGAALNCKRFEWSALRWNENALTFYDNLGARVLDDWVMLRMDQVGLRGLANNKMERVPK